MREKFSEEQIRTFQLLYQRGFPIRKIAEENGITENTIRRYFKKRQIEMSDRRIIPKDLKALILEIPQLSSRKLSKVLGISFSTINKYRRDHAAKR